MQHNSESHESPAPPQNMFIDLNDHSFMPFEEFKVYVDTLLADMMEHPERDQLLSDFRQMLHEMGIFNEDLVNPTDVNLEASSQAGAN